MSNAKEIKERMGSIQETKKITNAMYLISSSKMKQAKKKLSDTEPFFYGMQAVQPQPHRLKYDPHHPRLRQYVCVFWMQSASPAI